MTSFRRRCRRGEAEERPALTDYGAREFKATPCSKVDVDVIYGEMKK
jgi:hypothetical protein